MKTLVIAALAGTFFAAAPIVTVQAAPIPAKCLFFPLLQADCRDPIADALGGAADATADAAADVASASDKDWMGLPHPWFWVGCKSTGGTGPMFTCD